MTLPNLGIHTLPVLLMATHIGLLMTEVASVWAAFNFFLLFLLSDRYYPVLSYPCFTTCYQPTNLEGVPYESERH